METLEGFWQTAEEEMDFLRGSLFLCIVFALIHSFIIFSLFYCFMGVPRFGGIVGGKKPVHCQSASSQSLAQLESNARCLSSLLGLRSEAWFQTRVAFAPFLSSFFFFSFSFMMVQGSIQFHVC